MKWVALLCAAVRPAAADPAPRKVVVGVYVKNVYGLDIKQNQFTVDFYVWFRWKGDDLKPIETFELANSRITSKSGLSKKVFGTQNYASIRVIATITKFWDLRRYPLDDHTLAIEIEDSDQDSRTACSWPIPRTPRSARLQVPGWEVVGIHSSAATHTYGTNYGDVSLAHERASYARYRFEIWSSARLLAAS